MTLLYACLAILIAAHKQHTQTCMHARVCAHAHTHTHTQDTHTQDTHTQDTHMDIETRSAMQVLSKGFVV